MSGAYTGEEIDLDALDDALAMLDDLEFDFAEGDMEVLPEPEPEPEPKPEAKPEPEPEPEATDHDDPPLKPGKTPPKPDKHAPSKPKKKGGGKKKKALPKPKPLPQKTLPTPPPAFDESESADLPPPSMDDGDDSMPSPAEVEEDDCMPPVDDLPPDVLSLSSAVDLPPSADEDEDLPPPPGENGEECEECEDGPASKFCEDCGLNLCSDCSKLLHTKGTMRDHVLCDLDAPALAPRDGVCEDCEEKPAAKNCADCELVLCNDCAVDMHKKGAFKRHTLTDIGASEEEEEDKREDCVECQESPATKRCPECELVFCDECAIATHKKGAFKRHVLDDLDGGTSSKADKKCDVCDASTILYCPDCEIFLCDTCAAKMHSKGARKRHKLVSSVFTSSVLSRRSLASSASPDMMKGRMPFTKLRSSSVLSNASSLGSNVPVEHRLDRDFDGNLMSSHLQVVHVGGEAVVRGGSINALVTLAIHPEFNAPNYVTCFLATFPTYLSPETLFELLTSALDHHPMWRDKVLILVHNYIMDFEHDVRGNSDVLDAIRKLLTTASYWEGLENEVVRELKMLDLVMIPHPKSVPVPMASGYVKPPKEMTARALATALMVLDEKYFSRLNWRELLNTAWSSKDKEERAPTLLAWIRHSTRVSAMVANVIVHEPSVRRRAALIDTFIDAADECQANENYAALVALCSALQTSAVHRLKATWDLVPERTKQMYEEQQEVIERGHNNYRLLRAAQISADACIPYVGMYLTDLTFVEDGNPSLISSSFIKLKLKLSTGQTKSIRFDGRLSTETILERFLEDEREIDLGKIGMFVPPREIGSAGQWLDEDGRIFDYDLFGGEVIELRRRLQPLKYCIVGGAVNSTTLDVTQPTGLIVAYLLNRVMIKQHEHFIPYVDVPLDSEKTLWKQGVREDDVLEIHMSMDFEELKERMSDGTADDRMLELFFSDTFGSVVNQPIQRDLAINLTLLHMRSDYGHSLKTDDRGRKFVLADSGRAIIRVTSLELAGWSSSKESEIDWYLNQFRVSVEGDFREKKARLSDLLREYERGKSSKLPDREQHDGKSVDMDAFLMGELKAEWNSSSKAATKLEKEMAGRLEEVEGYSQLEAKIKFIEVVQGLRTHGGRFVEALMKNDDSKKKNSSRPVFIGATPTRLMALASDSSKQVLEDHFLEGVECIRDGCKVSFHIPLRRGGPLIVHCEDFSAAQRLLGWVAKRVRATGNETSKDAFSTDMHVEDEGDPDEYLLINFTKCMWVGRIVRNLRGFQEAASKRAQAAHRKPDPKVVQYVESFVGKSDDDLYNDSLQLEERGSHNAEKRKTFFQGSEVSKRMSVSIMSMKGFKK